MIQRSGFPYAPNALKAEDWQRALTDQFKLLDTLCRENGIKYTIAFGGLLGTVRHKGFIPWDNDVDIAVTEENYLKLRQLYLDGKMPEGYMLVDDVTDPAYPLLFGRFVNTNTCCPLSTSSFNGGVTGTFIDVFIMYPISSNRAEQIEQIERFQVWEELHCYLKRRCSARTPGFCEKWRELKKLEAAKGHEAALAYAEEQFRAVMPKSDFEWYLFSSTGNYLGYPLVKKEWYESTVRVPFADIEVEIPQGYAQVLQTTYGGSWREFPSGESFKAYSAPNLNLPYQLMREDYMQLLDAEETDAKYREKKELQMEEMLAERAFYSSHYGTRAVLDAVNLNLRHGNDAYVKKHAQKRAYATESFAELQKDYEQSVAIMREQLRPSFKQWHIALDVEPDLLAASMWSYYAAQHDYWSVGKAISLQDGDAEHAGLDDSQAVRELRQALQVTARLYFAIDDEDAAAIEAATAELEGLCANGYHTLVGRAFCLLQSDPQACLDFIEGCDAKLKLDDYLVFTKACALLDTGRTPEAEVAFAKVAVRRNGMLLQKAQARCEAAGIPFEVAPNSNPEEGPRFACRALTTRRFRHMKNPKIQLQLLKLTGALVKENGLEKAMHEARERVEPYLAFDEHCRSLRNLSRSRFALWEQMYPRQISLTKGIEEGSVAAVHKLINPYLHAVYRIMDNIGVGIFVDQVTLDVALPFIREERGEKFAEDFLAAIPEAHKEDFDKMLIRKGYTHPYLTDPTWDYVKELHS